MRTFQSGPTCNRTEDSGTAGGDGLANNQGSVLRQMDLPVPTAGTGTVRVLSNRDGSSGEDVRDKGD